MQTAHAEKASWLTGNEHPICFAKKARYSGTKFLKQPHFNSSCILVEYNLTGRDKAGCR